MTEGRPYLEATGVVAGYRPGLPIIFDVDVTVDRGEVVTIIGPNGAGKSTLLKAIAGLVIVEAGAIRLDTHDLRGIRPDRIGACGMAFVPQTSNIFTTLSIFQNLALAARRCEREPQARIEAMLELFPALEERRSLRAGSLSGGQRQMLAIAMALIAEPKIILMDEPTAGLAPKAGQEVLTLISEIAAQGVAVLLVEQNARMALAVSDRAYVMADGRNQLDGPAQQILDDPVVAEIYLGGRRRGAA